VLTRIQECGEGIRRAIDEGTVKREDLFIVTKIWCTFHGKYAIPSIKDSLKRWGLDYFDLVYIHFPISLEYVDPKVRFPPGWAYDGKEEIRYSKIPLQETYGYLEQAVQQGLIRHIGISNYNGALILDVLRYAKIRPSVLQIEHHPYLVQPKLYHLVLSANLLELNSPKKMILQSPATPPSALNLSVSWSGRKQRTLKSYSNTMSLKPQPKPMIALRRRCY